ncbi:MAG: NAD(P)-dependent oxidoreductase [Parachlamydiales bacterium]|jgi:phosphoglycerate dehydrogenase-like enzyme
MNIVLLQTRLALNEVDQLLKEFPQYLFLSLSEASYTTLSPEYWARIEIVYGNRMTSEDLTHAHQLKWIHLPGSLTNRICLFEIEKQGNVIVTNTKDEDLVQVGEFVMGLILSFGKSLFVWHEPNQNPSHVWSHKARENMWALKNKTLLQIGMQKTGTEIARQAEFRGMKVIGLDERKSFQPHFATIDSLENASTYLPQADVVCITLPATKKNSGWLDKAKIDLLKKGALLIILGSPKVTDEEALVEAARSERLRGVWMDIPFQTPPPATSPLWNTPNLFLSPEIAPRPRLQEKQSFRIFRYNLRQYSFGNINDMRNIVDKEALFA